jgi:glycosyltransferase involved in cell wall biosynthesis
MQLLLGLAEHGAEVDAFMNPPGLECARELRGRPGLRIFEEDLRWSWGRWYSRDPLVATTTSMLARLRAQKRLVARLREQHTTRRYDVIYQFSQFEVPWMAGRAHRLPPVVIHPEVHAAGELRWLRRERQLALRCSGRARTDATTAFLAGRALTQKRHARDVAAVIAPSHAFANQMSRDYMIADEKLHVVPNPIDLVRYQPPTSRPPRTAPVRLLFISRMAVRKGVEMVVALSHRLAAQPGAFHITLVGGGSLFSDYRPLLADLHPDVATYEGFRSAGELAQLYWDADIVLQPSHYEPFALTVGEALASGTPVVVSDEVGAGEGLPNVCCRTFPAGDLDRFEALVRGLASALADDEWREASSVAARAAAKTRFAPAVVSEQVLRVLCGCAAT